VALVVLGLGLATARGEEKAAPVASIAPPRAEKARLLPAREGGTKAEARPGSVAPVMGATVALLAVAGGAAWLARKGAAPGARGTGQGIEVVGRAAVGPRQGVVVVKVAGERLVLGVGGQGPPTLLARIDEAGGQPS
jgi:flagellar biosynthetic protein FliO